MRPALLTAARALGFAAGFCVLLGGGTCAAVVLLALAYGEFPPRGALSGTLFFLVLPLLAFRAFERRRSRAAKP